MVLDSRSNRQRARCMCHICYHFRCISGTRPIHKFGSESAVGDAPVGKEVVFVIESSLYDGTVGPQVDSSHVETPDPIDDSTFLSVRLVHPIVGFFDFIPGGLPTFLALIIFLILLAVLLVLLARRRRKT